VKIGVDIDNVITMSEGVLKEYSEQNNIKLSDKELLAAAVGSKINQRVTDFLVNHYQQLAKDLELMPGVIEALLEIKEKGHQVIIITARGSNLYPNAESSTIAYLDERSIPYDEILFSSHDKASVCLERGIDVLIDDSLPTCIKAREVGINAFLFTSRANANSEFEPRIASWSSQTIATILSLC